MSCTRLSRSGAAMTEGEFKGGLLTDVRHPIAIALEDHLAQLRSLRANYPLARQALEPAYVAARREYEQFKLQQKQADVSSRPSGDGGPRHAMPLSKTTAFHHIIRDHQNAKRGLELLSQGLLLQFVAQYDAFLGRLVRELFVLRPELPRGIKREVAFTSLDGLGTVQEVRDQLVEDEISHVLYKGHAEQLVWLEKQLNMRLHSDPELIGRFVEITQRRHLYAHTNGVVTNQYLTACQAHNFPTALTVGEVLVSDDDYVEFAYRTLYEIAVKLSHVTWRKVAPSERAQADEALSRICYSLLVFEEFELARTLLTFAVHLPEHSDDRARRTFIVNLAQSHKWLDQQSECLAVLDQEDWSACEDAFNLARAVLKDDYEHAKHLMLTVALHNDIERAAFEDWPLFRKFRATTEFADAYAQLYGSALPAGALKGLDAD